ncbi:MAG: LacI family DNA-binding transcriptional regulator [Cardiobacteriaceae bacterium]|nr:LacI family DNA-binding transcriptional regulator [Cardiobacteriaceae bacterium]
MPKKPPLTPPDKPIRTMQDLAAYVGLTRQTLSKYFRDPQSVNAKSRARIAEGIEHSGFRPNFFAANLKRRNSKVLGIIIPSAVDPFYMELVERIEHHANEAGFFVIALSSGGRREQESEAMNRLRAINAAGVLIAPSGSHPPRLRARNTPPVVYLDSPVDDTSPFVGTDNRQSIAQIVTYLLQSGSPPCYLGMPAINHNADSRREAYIKAMQEHNEQPRVLTLRGKLGWDFESYGYRNAAAHLRNGLPTDTILCANDRIAIGAQLAAWHGGRRVGKTADCNLRIAGHDDHPFSRYTSPPLTTIVQNTDLIARHAVTNIRRACGELDSDNSDEQRILVPATLVIRESA